MSAADENVPTHIETTDDDDASTVDSDLTSVVPDADPCILPTESSYLSGASPTGIIRPSNPDYDLCTPADLKGLMHSRGLRDSYPKGLTLKYFYLRQLDKADRAARFRFLELPAEIRLGVYRELLLFPDREDVKLGQADDVVYLAILLTCEQVYDEAKPVLYDDNVFSVGFRKIEEEGTHKFRATWAHREYADATCALTKRCSLPHAIDHYPAFLRGVSSIDVTLNFNKCDSSDTKYNVKEMSSFLLGFASFLMEGHRLKRLTLRLEISYEVEDGD